MKKAAFIILIFSTFILPQQNRELQAFGSKFFAWRASEQPCTGDDIPRVERPDKWAPDYSPQALKKYNKAYLDFKEELYNISKEGWSRSDSVDYLLLHSAVERINWELNVLKRPERDPDFYVYQTVGAVYDLLVISTPMTPDRARNIIIRLKSIPKTIKDAEENLTEPVQAFADIALGNLDKIGVKLDETEAALDKIFPDLLKDELGGPTKSAAAALEAYAKWLTANKSKMSNHYSVGRKGYEYFLKNIALMPYTPEELLKMGHMEWDRAVAFDELETVRDKNIPKEKIFKTVEDQIKQEKKDEESIRKFIKDKNIMSVPAWVQHYVDRKLPAHVAPLSGIGETDDFTSPTRLTEDGVRYLPDPSPSLPFFAKASAMDPRPIIIHEGVPGHYFQLVRSWANIDPIRRHYFDSGANEGIGFYLEEMMLQLGLFQDRLRTREIIYKFMRLRALRVDVDVNLALGNYDIKKAGEYLAETVPMDKESAEGEAGFFAQTPGQGISYQIGKIQLLKLIADAKVKMGDKFSLKKFHDYMMQNGNVPIALMRWEYLGLKDEISKLWPE